MKPGIRPGETPALHRLGEYVFQDLCRDLLDSEPEVVNCEVYGKRGETQYGIDLLAQRKGDASIEVGQCKCYEDFPPAKIRQASDEFLEHWERWSKEGVKRFVLMVACDLESVIRQDEIRAQVKRFREYGIDYEAWSAAKIINKLRPRPDLVSSYFKPPEVWVQEICGKSLPAVTAGPVSAAVIVPAMLMGQLEELAGQLASARERELEHARELWRQGHYSDAVTWLRSVKESKGLWHAIAPAVRAKILRFEASLALHSKDDIAQAIVLAKEAHELVPDAPAGDMARTHAAIAYFEHRLDDAISLLRGHSARESREFLAGLLIESGRLAEAWKLLDAEDIKSSAEGLRLRALAYLVDKKLPDAECEAEKALRIEPRWESTRFATAMIGYYGSLSPCALGALGPWPEPVSWKLVRRDANSVLRLRRAAQIFLDLAAVAEQPSSRGLYEVWHLACLLNDAERQEDAIAFCHRIIVRDPGNAGAILWANARRIEFDFQPSVEILRKNVENKSARPADVLALASIYLLSTRAELADLLEQTRSIFEKSGLESIWLFWRAQSLIMAGETQRALDIAGSLGADLLAARIMGMVLVAGGTNPIDESRLVKTLEERFADTGDLVFLLDVCTSMARRREWSYVADRAEVLVDGVATLDALHLAVSCVYNARRFKDCVRLLDRHCGILPSGRLTGELRRIRAACLESLGGIAEALQESEILVRDEPTLENWLRLASVLISAGDLGRLAVVAREVERYSELTPQQAIQLATVLQPQEPIGAASLVRRAVEVGVPDELIGNVLSLASQLGMSDVMRRVGGRMQDLASQGVAGFRMMELHDLISMQSKHGEDAKYFDGLYRNGGMPFHFVAAWARQPLVVAFHQMLADNESKPVPERQPSLYVRSGRRSLQEALANGRRWRVWLDVSAVLLAEHLGVLDGVERAFRPLGVPPSLVLALVEMRTAIERSQPEMVRATERIVELVDGGALGIVEGKSAGKQFGQPRGELDEGWLAMFALACEQQGYLVDFLPVRKVTPDFGPADLPAGANRTVASCWSILEALNQSGALPDDAHRVALDALGSSCHPDNGAIPQLGRTLFFRQGVIELFASAGVLDVVLERFKVSVESNAVDSMRAEIRQDRRRRDLGRWLDALIGRLRNGLVDGRYERLPVAENDSENPEKLHNFNASAKCMVELLRLAPPTGTAVWVDDRWFNAHSSIGDAAVVGIVEILTSLIAAGEIGAAQYFEKIARLRAANVRFIPLAEAELLHELKRASVRRSVVVETRELTVLRRSFAACLCDYESIQRPTSFADQGEFRFVQDSATAINEAIISLWRSEEDRDENCARADWLLSEMHVDLVGFAKNAGVQFAEKGETLLDASGLMQLVIGAFTIDHADVRSDRSRYLAWLSRRLLDERFASEPDTVRHLAHELVRRFSLSLSDVMTEDERADLIEVFHDRIEAFPPALVEEIKSTAGFDGLRSRRLLVSIQGVQFKSVSFWEAAERVLNGGGEEHLETSRGDEVALRHRSIPGVGVALELIFKDGKSLPVDDVALAGVVASASEREAILARHRHSLDLSDEVVRRLCRDFPSTSALSERVRYFSELHSSSPNALYFGLVRRVRLGRRVFVDEMWRVDCDALVYHHRLPAGVGVGEAFGAALENAALVLEREVGLGLALSRLSGLPVPLPMSILSSVDSLAPEARRELFGLLVRTPGSPVSRFHLIRLLWTYRHERPAYGRLSSRLALRALLPDGELEFDAFRALVTLVGSNFKRMDGSIKASFHLKMALSWLHAHHLWSALGAAGVDIDSWREMVKRDAIAACLDPVAGRRTGWRDVANSEGLGWLRFVLSGLGYSFDGSVSQELRGVGLRLVDLVLTRQSSSGERVAELSLLRDESIAPNCLRSFLGRDRSEWLAALTSVESVLSLSSECLEQVVKLALTELLVGVRVAHRWQVVGYTLGGSPVYPALRSEVERAVVSTDWMSLVKADINSGVAAMGAACSVVGGLAHEEAFRYLSQQWKMVVEYIAWRLDEQVANAGSEGDVDELIDRLFLAALELAASRVDVDSMVMELIELLSCLAGFGVFVASRRLRILVEELGARSSAACRAKFWPLLMRVRAAQVVGLRGALEC